MPHHIVLNDRPNTPMPILGTPTSSFLLTFEINFFWNLQIKYLLFFKEAYKWAKFVQLWGFGGVQWDT